MFGNPRYAAIAGAVFLLGRVIYALGYWSLAGRRSFGYAISTTALAITWVLALASVLRNTGFA